MRNEATVARPAIALLVLAASVVALVAVQAAGAAARAADVARTYDLQGFDRIEIAGVYDVDIEVGEDYAVELEGPADEMARVDVRIEDGALVLGVDKKRRRGGDRQGVDAVVRLPNLTGLSISGVAEVDARGGRSDRFETAMSGVGDVTLAGECGVFDASVSGVGDLDADGLRCRDVAVRVSGVGSASVYAAERVDAKVSGMGSIDVKGSPSEVKKQGGFFSSVDVR
ncbi:MAG: head GIN domain-containing protein [Parvularculaceae bacterium]